MIRYALRLGFLLLLAGLGWGGWLVFYPVQPAHLPYAITVGPNRSLGQVAHSLQQENVIRSRRLLLLLARVQGTDRYVKAGLYRFSAPFSLRDVLQRFAEGNPDEASITIVEGWTFKQFRALVDQDPDIRHDSVGLSDADILHRLGVSIPCAEGLFFPSTYYFSPGASDLDIYRRAWVTMENRLQTAWAGRAADLPLHSPYQMLILASLVEKETARDADRPLISAVFLNRLTKKMRLQTDPSVIYGLGSGYDGRLGKAELRQDTPYNTYTRDGLPPSPIALPGEAALNAAANPAKTDVLYFVARGDGGSFFSRTLEQHNEAVRKFILKKDP